MNISRSSFRTVAALGAGLALTVAACGGDDDDAADTTDATTTTTTTTASAAEPTDPPDSTPAEGGEPAMQPASIVFDDQSSNGTSITVASAELPAAGFIAVHSDGGGSPGPVIGVSDLLPAGVSTDVSVDLDTALDGDTTLFPMIHIDTNDNGIYEFGSVEGVDGPGVTASGDVAVVGGAVTVDGGGSDAGGDTDASGDTITIADFAFDGVTEVAVGTTVVVTNTDGTPHTWTSEDGTFDSGALGSGDTFEFTFDAPGEFAYFCNFHPSMTGTITVTG